METENQDTTYPWHVATEDIEQDKDRRQDPQGHPSTIDEGDISVQEKEWNL